MDRRAFLATIAGSLLTAPLAAEAQAPTSAARIGVLSSGPASLQGQAHKAFLGAMAELGWLEGRNLVVESRYAEGRPESLNTLATELVRARVQVILASNTFAVIAAKEATPTVPIVGIGTLERLVQNLGRPEGNVTGLVTIPLEAWGKQVELLKEAAPKISRVAYLVEGAPGSPEPAARAAAIGRSLQLTLHPLAVRQSDQLNPAFRTALERRVDGLALVDTPFLSAHRGQIVDFVAKHKLPSVSMFSGFAEAGFLLSYGTNIPALYRRAAHYVDRVLKGAKPADLPIERPTKFDLVINLKTAKALGLTIPPSLLLRADQVIE